MNEQTRYPRLFLLSPGWVIVALLVARLGILPCLGNQTLFHLRNGDKVSGVVISETNGAIVISNSLLGRIQFATNTVERRESVLAHKVSPDPKQALVALSNDYSSGRITAQEYHQKRATLLAQNQPMPKAGGQPMNPPGPAPPPGPVAVSSPPRPKRWSGEALLGIDLLFSENQRQLYSGRFKLGYNDKMLRNLLDYQFAYGRTDGITSDNRMYATDKTDYEIGHDFYVYNLGGLGYDRIRKINFRFESGPGIGYHLVRLTNFVLNTEFGINYQAQYQNDDTTTESFYFRLAEDFAWKITPRLALDEKFEFFPRVDRFDTYRFRLEANLRYALRNNLSLVLTLLDQYDTRPAEAVSQNDLQIRSSVGLKF